MKFKLLLLVVSVVGILDAAANGVVPLSDALNVYAVPPGVAPILFASASASEADENGANTVHFVMTLGATPHTLAGNPAQYNNATVLLDANNQISDIFGVYRSGTENNFVYEVAFISDPDPGEIVGNSFPGFGTLDPANELPENQNSYDATRYLGLFIGAVPYTASFASDQESVPDSSTTCVLLGMGLTGLAWLRRRLS